MYKKQKHLVSYLYILFYSKIKKISKYIINNLTFISILYSE